MGAEHRLARATLEDAHGMFVDVSELSIEEASTPAAHRMANQPIDWRR